MAIDPKLVSIIPASQLPTGDPTSAADFLFYEGDALKKGSMSNIYDKVTSGIKGIATQTNAPTPGAEFEIWKVEKPLTLPNSWGFAVTADELKDNFVYFNVTNGVVSKELSLKPLVDYSFNLLLGKTYEVGLGNPIVTDLNGKKYIKWNAATGEALKVAGVLAIGQTYQVAIKFRANHTDDASLNLIKLTIGSAYSSIEIANCKFTTEVPNRIASDYQILEFTANSVDFWIGKIPLTASGYSVVIDDIILINKNDLKEQTLLNYTMSQKEDAERIIALEDETMSIQWGWNNSVGTPLSISGGKLNLNLTAGQNQSVKINYLNSQTYTKRKLQVSLKARLVSGTGAKLLVGKFGGTFDPQFAFEITPISTEQTFTGEIYIEKLNTIETQFNIGALAANNQGGVIEIDDLQVTEISDSDLETTTIYSNIQFSNVEGIFANINTSNPHNEIKLIGDSLTANPIGGVIPNVESIISRRPFRMTTANNYPRRLYDKYCLNKPNWRRLDDSDWVKTGVWTSLTDITVFEPAHANDRYDRTIEPSASAEFSIPDNDEYLVLILKEATGFGTLNFTINGVAPTTLQGVSNYNCNYTSVGHCGNPYKKLLFKLPSGTGRKFKITKDATASPVMVWGVYSWVGSTIIFTPIAHGGHTMNDLLTQHYADEYVRNKSFTNAVVFEVPEMNDTRTPTIEDIENYLKIWISNLSDKDVLFTTCNILGTDPTDGTPNYYLTTQTNGFNQKQMNDAVKKIIIDNNIPFIDLFTIYERATISRGGSIENGDAGLYFTHDGQHGNEAGVSLWFQSISVAFNKMPIYSVTL